MTVEKTAIGKTDSERKKDLLCRKQNNDGSLNAVAADNPVSHDERSGFGEKLESNEH